MWVRPSLRSPADANIGRVGLTAAPRASDPDRHVPVGVVSCRYRAAEGPFHNSALPPQPEETVLSSSRSGRLRKLLRDLPASPRPVRTPDRGFGVTPAHENRPHGSRVSGCASERSCAVLDVCSGEYHRIS